MTLTQTVYFSFYYFLYKLTQPNIQWYIPSFIEFTIITTQYSIYTTVYSTFKYYFNFSNSLLPIQPIPISLCSVFNNNHTAK